MDVSMLIPKQKENGEIIAVWDMSDYARNHNMKIRSHQLERRKNDEYHI